MMYWGMACHSWISAASNCWRVTGCTALERTHLPSSAHKCSIGFRSGLRDGHGMTSTHCWRRNGKSCNMRPHIILLKQPQTILCHERKHQRRQDGIPVCHCIKTPCTTGNGVLWSGLTPAHTMIPPPPHRLCSKTQHCANLSPRHL